MANVLVAEQSLQDIADAIRGKNGKTTTYKPGAMATAISSIISGREYEEGTYSPTSDTEKPKINFTKTHSTKPAFAIIADCSGTKITEGSSVSRIFCISFERLLGAKSADNSSATRAEVKYSYFTNSANTSTSSSMSTTGLYMYASYWEPTYSSVYFVAGRTYKWIAIW
jgi:hypothetical protein